MAHCESYAKDLFRERPSEPSALLEDKRFWDVAFLRIYLDHCDEVLFNNPKVGLELAETALALALLIPERRPAEWRHVAESEKQLHRDLLVRAYAVLGGAYRSNARFEDAERTYASALELCESMPVGRAARANVKKRLAVLRSTLRQFEKAIELVDYAIEIYEEEDPDYFADSLNTKGYVLGESGHYSEAVTYFSRALALAKPTRRASSLVKRTFYSAVHNLASALSYGCHYEDLLTALHWVKKAKKSLAKSRDSINKHKLSWIEGRIEVKLGSDRRAERRFLSTIRGLMNLEAAFEAALVALELSLIYRQWGQWTKLAILAAETYEGFRELSADAEALSALKLWVEGAERQTLEKAGILETSKLIEGRVYRSAIRSRG